MASWGLAFEYGKNAYEDMWKKQEENRRLAKSAELYDTTVEDQTAEAKQVLAENTRSRQWRDVLNKYQTTIQSGGVAGKQAYVAALNEMGVPTTLTKDGKVATVNSDGTIDSTSAIDLSKWTGAELLSELSKRISPAAQTGKEFRDAAAKEKELAVTMRGQDLTYAGAMAKANATRAAAIAKASGKNNGNTKNMSYKDAQQAVGDSAAMSIVGSHARYGIKEDGTSFLYDIRTGEPLQLTETQMNNFSRAYSEGIQRAFALSGQYGMPVAAAGHNVGTRIGNDIAYATDTAFNLADHVANPPKQKETKSQTKQTNPADTMGEWYFSGGLSQNVQLYPWNINPSSSLGLTEVSGTIKR